MNETTIQANLLKVLRDAQNYELDVHTYRCLVKDPETLVYIICSEWNKSYFAW